MTAQHLSVILQEDEAYTLAISLTLDNVHQPLELFLFCRQDDDHAQADDQQTRTCTGSVPALKAQPELFLFGHDQRAALKADRSGYSGLEQAVNSIFRLEAMVSSLITTLSSLIAVP